MRTLIASIVVGPLMLIGVQQVAGQPTSSGSQSHLVADGNSTAERETYTRGAGDEMREWRQKLQNFDETAKAEGHEAGTSADNALNAAWIKVRAEENKLRVATAEDWDLAKVSFEKADRELADAWHKARPLGK
jgi:hypothetical protein